MDKIAILLEEYKTLRTEVISRTGYGFQAGAVFVVVVTWLSQQLATAYWLLAIIATTIITFVAWIFFRRNNQEIWNAGLRLREIEHSVNSRAGAQLLQWERRFGGSRDSFNKSLLNASPPSTEAELPPLDEKLKGDL